MPSLFVPPYIASLEPYPPGKPVEELKRELGLTRVVKLASNENPFGPSPKAAAAVAAAAMEIHRYPDGSGHYLKQALSRRLGHPAERIVLGSGCDNLLDLISRVFVGPGGRAVLPHPSFLIYQTFLKATGASFTFAPLTGPLGMDLDLDALLAKVMADPAATRLVVVCNPNNPTGSALAKRDIARFLGALPEHVVALVDEAYIDFARAEGVGTCLDLVSDDNNVVVARTFSKLYGLAGLRVGYGVMSRRLSDYLNRVREPFNVNSLALAGALAALDDEEFAEQTRRRIWAGLDELDAGMRALGVETFPSQANFILAKPPRPAGEVFQELLRRGVIVRHMAAFGLPEHLRINVGTPEEQRILLAAMAEVLKESRPR